MRPEDFLCKKNFPKLMVMSVAVSLVISYIIFYFTQNAVISAAVAATLIVSDYAALKLLTKDEE